ncbi:transcriptional regulator ATRX homolog isoform X2 [Bacillus rossius redtenbacheri]|uniref:transcriptional regulator ATRX homolog isoform X2 n=1 Tax=Bacillus rossius redtenbacheri TaxID=93214 RepID=UPI002FDEB58A
MSDESSCELMSASQDTSEEEDVKPKDKSLKKKKFRKPKLDYKLLSIEETEEEVKYRRKLFRDIDDVLNADLKCTSCSKNLIGIIKSGQNVFRHLTLDVLLCKKCFDFFGDGEFSADEDGTDKYCRWCGQGGTLYCCSKCPCAFCKSCIKRNMSASVLVDLEQEDWLCLICNSRPLWRLRGTCAAALKYVIRQKRLLSEKRKQTLMKLEEKKKMPQKRRTIKRRDSSSDFESRDGTPEASCSGLQTRNHVETKENGRSVRNCVRKSSKVRIEGNEAEVSEVSCDEQEKGSKEKEGNRKTCDASRETDLLLNSQTSLHNDDLDDNMPEMCDEKMSNKALLWLQDTVADICDVMKDVDEDIKTLSEKKIKLKNAKKPVKVSRLVNYFHKICQKLRSDLDSVESDLDLCHDHWKKNVVKREKKRNHLAKSSPVAVESDRTLEKNDDQDISKVKSKSSCTSIAADDAMLDKGGGSDCKVSRNNEQETDECKLDHASEAKGVCESESETVHASEADTVQAVVEALPSVDDITGNSPSTSDVEGIASKLVNYTSKANGNGSDGKINSKSMSCQSSGIDTDDEVESVVIGETLGGICGVEHDKQSEDHGGDGKKLDQFVNPLDNPLDRKKLSEAKNMANSFDGSQSEVLEAEGNRSEQMEGAEVEVGCLEGSVTDKDDVDTTPLNPCKDNDKVTKANVTCDNLNESSDIFLDFDNSEENADIVKGTIPEVVEKSKNGNKDKSAECDDDDRNSVCTFEVLSESAEDNVVGHSEAPNMKGENSVEKEIEIKKPLIFVRKDLMANDSKSLDDKLEVKDDSDKVVDETALVNGQLLTRKERSVIIPKKDISLTEEAVKARQALLDCSTGDDESDESQKSSKKRKRKKVIALMKIGCHKIDVKPNRVRRPGPASKVKRITESDTDSDVLDSDEEDKPTKSLKKIKAAKCKHDCLSAYENDTKLKLKAEVAVQRLPKTEDEKYKSKFLNAVESSEEVIENEERPTDEQSTCEKEVDRLCNLKLLKRSRNKDSSSCSGEEVTPQKKKIKKKKLDKVKNDDSPEGSKKSLSDVDDDTVFSDTQGSERQLARQEPICTVTENDMAKKLLLDMSSSDESGELTEEENTAKTKKSKKGKQVLENKNENVEGNEGVEKNPESPDNVDVVNGVKVEDDSLDKVEKSNSIESNDIDEKKENESEDEKSVDKAEKKEVSAENVENTKKVGESDNDSSDSDTKVVKKKSWRRDKLLSGKLSLTDSSEEERCWEKNKAKREAKLEKIKKKARKVLGSDSDDFKPVSNDSSSDSDFVSTKKRQRGKNNSDSDSVKTIDSDSSSKKSKQKRKRIKRPRSDSSDSDGLETSQRSEGQGKGRKNIRRVIKDDDVGEATRRAAREEDERRKRIAEKQKVYNELYDLPESFEALDKLVLDFDPETKEELVSVHPKLVAKLKPHQVKGVKFMWDACFESVRQIKKSKGTGCILAHCMGLGKTFQVVTLAHTVLTNKATKVKTILVVVPKSTVLNWISEFKLWLKDTKSKFMINDLSKTKKYKPRMLDLWDWHSKGGIMVLSYEMFRDLVLLGPQKLRRKGDADKLHEALLDPGPDLVVCDEGHLLKNETTKISKAMTKIGTLRRIVLTGTPLQNNLAEYHCMVQFVKPNLLGTRKEFQNRFVNPIINGSYVDSNAHDVKVMKRRAHVLHKMLEGSIQRFDYAVLTPYLPPKQEYAIFIRLTELQIKLYQYYLDHNAPDGKAKTAKLFTDFHIIQRICTHPRVLQMNFEKNEKTAEKKRFLKSDSEGSLKNFIDDGNTSESDVKSTSSSDSDVVCVEDGEKKDNPTKRPGTRRTRQNPEVSDSEPEVEEEVKTYQEWWQPLIEDDKAFSNLAESGKLLLLFSILRECEKIGDKVLVFSQSLFSLDLIEYFLHQIDEASQAGTVGDLLCNHSGSWSPGLDYFRFDGGTSLDNRSYFCKAFNNEENLRARLFLISTKAGGLGINLFGANRVIIFDASWNPSHDVQSIFRVYRFGQKKPCYIYRFLAKGTMEEKIYDRQVTKLSLSCRVVDEQQIERHYNMADLQELYNFNPEPSTTSTPMLPKDRLLAELLKEHEKIIETYHEHDSLLENKEEEELNEEERKAAWDDYENEKKGKPPQGMGMGMGLNQVDSVALKEAIRKENPALTEQELDVKFAETWQRIAAYMRQMQLQKTVQQNLMYQQQIRNNYNYQQAPQVMKTTPVLHNIATKQNYPVINMSHGSMYAKQYTPAAGGYAYTTYGANLPKGSTATALNSQMMQQPSSSKTLPKVDASHKPVYLNPASTRKGYNMAVGTPREYPGPKGAAGKMLNKKQNAAKPPVNSDDIETID